MLVKTPSAAHPCSIFAEGQACDLVVDGLVGTPPSGEPNGRGKDSLTKKAGMRDDEPLTVYKPYGPIYSGCGW
jgi:hypothetical protein